jgi:TRAP-type C4-dicarboxylate transport system substrate-binding protein
MISRTRIILLATLFLISGSLEAARIKIATLAPEGTAWMKTMREGAKEIKKATDGRVKFKFYTGGVMGNDSAVLKKIRLGQLQGGALTTTALAAVYPEINIYSLPFIFNNSDEAEYVRKTLDPYISKGLEKKGIILLGVSDGGFAYLMSRKPIHRIKDLRKTKAWIPVGDDVSGSVFRSAGINPVPLPIADVYTGLQTGLIDTITAPPMSTIALQWHSKMKYALDFPLVYVVGTLVVDKKAFNKLNKEDQAIVKKVMGEKFKTLSDINRNDNKKAKAALKNQGIQFTKPNKNEEAPWRALGDKSSAKMNAQLDPRVRKIVDKAKKDYRAKH